MGHILRRVTHWPVTHHTWMTCAFKAIEAHKVTAAVLGLEGMAHADALMDDLDVLVGPLEHLPVLGTQR